MDTDPGYIASASNPANVDANPQECRRAFEVKLSVLKTRATLFEGLARQKPTRLRSYAGNILKETVVLDNLLLQEIVPKEDPAYAGIITEIANIRNQATLYYEAAEEIDCIDSTPAAPVVPSSSSSSTVDPDLFRFRKVAAPELSDARSYRVWWEYFSNAVHNNPSLEDRHKMIQLSTSTSGDARKFLRGFPQTGDHYQSNLREIQARYGDPSKLIQYYLSDFAALPNLSGDSAVTLEQERSNLDQIKSLFVGLTSAGHTDTAIVQGWIFDKLPHARVHEAVVHLLDKYPRRDFPVEELLARLESNLVADEFIELRRVNKGAPSSDDQQVVPATTLAHAGKTKGGARSRRRRSASERGNDSSSQQRTSCMFCAKKHTSKDCQKFKNFLDRRQRLSELRRCSICFSTVHDSSSCTARDRECRECHKVGHQAPMCVAYIKAAASRSRSTSGVQKPRRAREDPRSNNNDDVHPPASGGAGTFLETFVSNIIIDNRSLIVRGMIDGGSDTSYIRNSILQRLNVRPMCKVTISVSSFGTNSPTLSPSGEISVTFLGQNGVRKVCVLLTTNCIVSNSSLSPPADEVVRMLPSGYNYADPDLFSSNRRPIELLIGNDIKNIFVRINRDKVVAEGLILRPTFFGWIPSGSVIRPSSRLCNTLANVKTDDNDLQVSKDTFLNCPEITSLWELEVLGIKSSELENTDHEVIEFFRRTTRFDKELNRYVVSWPRRTHNLNLPTHYRMCVARLRSLLNNHDSDILSKYNDIFQDYLKLGIIERAPVDSRYPCHYLPHRPVIRNHTSHSVRPVFDGSAKLKSSHSLNEMLHSGPPLTQSLLDILMNFRTREIALSADIEKAFLHVGLDIVDRDLVRFLWVEDYNSPLEKTSIVVYRFTRTPFGIISSPFLLNMVLLEHLGASNDELQLFARKRFYVDNFVLSVENITYAVELSQSVTESLRSAGFNLRHWASNSIDFMNTLPPEKHLDDEGVISILGYGWDRANDTLSIRFDSDKEKNISLSLNLERALSALASVYDPLGLCSPCVLDLKVFVQKCWKNKAKWGESLPHMEAEFRKLISDREEIKRLTFPRYLWKTVSTKGTYELHCFCDASKVSFGCCVYLVHKNSYSAETQLVFAKGRVAPMKERSIPQLELLASVIGKRAVSTVRGALDLKISRTVVWSDATTVLQWLDSSTVQPQFVQNRITELRKATDLTYRYVPTKDNPADILSRGQRASQLNDNELWWHGPYWVGQERLWPTPPPNVSEYKSSIRPVVTFLSKRNRGQTIFLTDEFEKRYSLWRSYINYVRRIPPLQWLFRKHSLTPSETYRRAEMILVRLIQQKYFHKEIRYLEEGASINSELCPFLDATGIIRCRNRLELSPLEWDSAHPIYLPRESPLVRVLILSIHVQTHHQGSGGTLSEFRSRFYITRNRSLINSVIHRCTWCRRWKGGPFKLPPMPALPTVRTTPVIPFMNVGLDCFGPLRARIMDKEATKVYVVIFVCLVTRAIHLELLYDMSGDQFLQALIRFTSRRGVPYFVVSDNGRNFVFTQPLVGEKVKLDDPRIKEFTETNGINWHFIPPYQPWQGGVYEKLIGIVKSSLLRVVGSRIVDLSNLQTALCQVESIVNSRPLTYMAPNEIAPPLTPNSFLRPANPTGVGELSVDVSNIDSNASLLITGYKRTRRIVQMFQSQFYSKYLLLLRDNYRRMHPAPKGASKYAPRVGEIVLVRDEKSSSRAKWPLGLIEALDSRKAQAQVRIIDWVTTNKVGNMNPDSSYKTKIVNKSVSLLHPLEVPYEPPVEEPMDIDDVPSSSMS